MSGLDQELGQEESGDYRFDNAVNMAQVIEGYASDFVEPDDMELITELRSRNATVLLREMEFLISKLENISFHSGSVIDAYEDSGDDEAKRQNNALASSASFFGARLAETRKKARDFLKSLG